VHQRPNSKASLKRSGVIARRLGAVVAAIVLAAVVAACSSSSSSGSASSASSASGASSASSASGSIDSGSGAGTTPASVIAAAQAAVTAAYGSGYDGSPPTTGPAAVTGKKVWYISCGQQAASCAEQATNFQEAAKVLGWQVTLCDSKLDSTIEAACVQQAVAAHADGIALNSFDCDKGKSVLQQAKNADIPVINWNGQDCGPVGSAASLFTAGVNFKVGSNPPSESNITWFTIWGKLMADYAIAKLDGKGSVIFFHETTYTSLIATTDAYDAEMAKAPGIKVISVPFEITQIPNETTPLIKSSLLANPNASAVQTEVDSLIPLGMAAAIKAGPNPKIEVFGAEGTQANIDLIREGVQTDSVVRLDDQSTWAQADELNRVFAGVKPADLPAEGSGFQIVDAQHNLPAAGTPYQAPVNYQAIYTKIWTGK
jgi:ribose transport system substrate-binding protein